MAPPFSRRTLALVGYTVCVLYVVSVLRGAVVQPTGARDEEDAEPTFNIPLGTTTDGTALSQWAGRMRQRAVALGASFGLRAAGENGVAAQLWEDGAEIQDEVGGALDSTDFEDVPNEHEVARDSIDLDALDMRYNPLHPQSDGDNSNSSGNAGSDGGAQDSVNGDRGRSDGMGAPEDAGNSKGGARIKALTKRDKFLIAHTCQWTLLDQMSAIAAAVRIAKATGRHLLEPWVCHGSTTRRSVIYAQPASTYFDMAPAREFLDPFYDAPEDGVIVDRFAPVFARAAAGHALPLVRPPEASAPAGADTANGAQGISGQTALQRDAADRKLRMVTMDDLVSYGLRLPQSVSCIEFPNRHGIRLYSLERPVRAECAFAVDVNTTDIEALAMLFPNAQPIAVRHSYPWPPPPAPADRDKAAAVREHANGKDDDGRPNVPNEPLDLLDSDEADEAIKRLALRMPPTTTRAASVHPSPTQQTQPQQERRLTRSQLLRLSRFIGTQRWVGTGSLVDAEVPFVFRRVQSGQPGLSPHDDGRVHIDQDVLTFTPFQLVPSDPIAAYARKLLQRVLGGKFAYVAAHVAVGDAFQRYCDAVVGGALERASSNATESNVLQARPVTCGANTTYVASSLVASARLLAREQALLSLRATVTVTSPAMDGGDSSAPILAAGGGAGTTQRGTGAPLRPVVVLLATSDGDARELAQLQHSILSAAAHSATGQPHAAPLQPTQEPSNTAARNSSAAPPVAVIDEGGGPRSLRVIMGVHGLIEYMVDAAFAGLDDSATSHGGAGGQVVSGADGGGGTGRAPVNRTALELANKMIAEIYDGIQLNDKTMVALVERLLLACARRLHATRMSSHSQHAIQLRAYAARHVCPDGDINPETNSDALDEYEEAAAAAQSRLASVEWLRPHRSTRPMHDEAAWRTEEARWAAELAVLTAADEGEEAHRHARRRRRKHKRDNQDRREYDGDA